MENKDYIKRESRRILKKFQEVRATGFSMGATSNAMANMQVVTKKYGPSPVAYFAIPMVGSLFIDFFNASIIAFNIGLWS